jgi:hypothetical protein
MNDRSNNKFSFTRNKCALHAALSRAVRLLGVTCRNYFRRSCPAGIKLQDYA